MRLGLVCLCVGIGACGTSEVPGGGGGEVDATVVAPVTVKLTVTVEGSGSVMVSGAATACTAPSCSFDFNKDTMVTLTAQAQSGSRFTAWGGACSGGDASAMVAMDAAKSCSARFVERIAVTGAVSGATGAVSASSTDAAAACAGASCTIDLGGSLTLTAPVIAGSRFTGWSGAGCAGTAPVLALTAVSEARTCTATYVAGLRVAGAVVGATGTVDASSTSPGATCASGACTLDPGGSVTLTAPVIAGNRFVGWSGDAECMGTTAALTLAGVTHDVSCSAGYLARYTVSGTTMGATGGKVTVTSTDSTAVCTDDATSCVVDARGKARLEVNAPAGYRFSGWSGGCTGTDNPLLLTNVSGDRACVATFVARVTIAGTVAAGGPTAAVTATSMDMFKDCAAGNACTLDTGGSAMLLAPMTTGFRFTGWSGPGAGCAGGANPLVLTGVTADTACVAGYVPRVTVTGVVAGAMSTVTATSTDMFKDCAAGNACTVDTGGGVTLTATAVQGMTFAGWFGTGCPASAELSVKLTGVTSSVTCTATFKGRVTIVIEAVGAQPDLLVAESSAPGAQCSGDRCTVEAGSAVQLTVDEPTGYRFVGWTGAPCIGNGLGQLITVTVTADGTCTAHFVDFASTVAPVLVEPWPSPTGWRNVDGSQVRMSVQFVIGAVYECRTGRTKVASTSPSFIDNVPWVPCDGADGMSATVLAQPITGDENGSYVTWVRMRIVEYVSDEVAHFYYAHDSLDGMTRCTPRFSDAQLYAVVKQNIPPGETAPLNTSKAFSTSVALALPFLTMVYSGAAYNSWSVRRGANGEPVPANPLFQSVLSLRHSFSMSADRTMVFVKRGWEARRPLEYQGKLSCGNAFEFGWQEIEGTSGCLDHSCPGSPARAMIHCDALVLNSAGQGVCVRADRLGRAILGPYSQSAWRKLSNGTKGISPKRLSPFCFGTTRDCEVSLYLPP